jgi:acyl-CoA synthetase (AMP-forming)/AMP-acid ligase II
LFVSDVFLGADYRQMLRDTYGDPLGEVPFRDLPDLRTVVVIGDDAGSDIRFDKFLVEGENLPELPADAAPAADDPCEVLFTSGTTGQPKGVLLGHQQMLENYWIYGRTAGFNDRDRYLVVMPFGHGGGINGCTLTCLLHGITNLPVPVFEANRALDLITKEKVTVIMGVPTHFADIFHSPARASHDLSSLRTAIVGAAITPPDLIAELRELGIERVINAYGLIEGSAVSMTRAEDSTDVLETTVGRPLHGVELQLLDDDVGPVPTGQPGEIYLRGPGVMLGYLDAPDLTAEVVSEDGWLRTGDLGVLDTHGNLRIIDRKKEMFTAGGFNVYPAEVERLLMLHPGVSAAAVVGVPDDRLGEVGFAFVVRSDESLSASSVSEWAKNNMANYKIPRHIEFVAELPLNPTGKVDKPRLHQRSLDVVGQ